MSERVAKVIPINLIKHPNADSLSINEYGGYTTVLRTEDWIGRELGIFIEPDTIVDTTRPEFSFLDPNGKPFRVKAKRLRQVWSMGLTIPAPEGAQVGDDYYEKLGLRHYEPEEEHISTGGNFAKAPSLWGDMTKYDVDNGRNERYSNIFTHGEIVLVTHKLNGSNVAFVFSEDEMFCRSRSGFRTREDNIFWRCLTHEMEKFCTDNPNHVLYGEVIGNVKGYRYDVPQGQVSFRCFDIMQPNRQYTCVDRWQQLCKDYNIPTVPIIGRMPFDMKHFLELCQVPCPLGNPISEGIVVKSLVERRDYMFGRAILKFVNPAYSEKN